MKYRKSSVCQIYERGRFEPVLMIFARGEDGKRHKIKKYGLPSYFFTAEEPDYPADLEEKVKGIESGYTSIYGTPIWKVNILATACIKKQKKLDNNGKGIKREHRFRG